MFAITGNCAHDITTFGTSQDITKMGTVFRCKYIQNYPLHDLYNLERFHFNWFILNHFQENNYCGDDNEDELEQGWNAPETVPVCLILHLKTICLWDFQGCPDDMEVAKYLVKHGKALNNVTIHTPFSENKEMKSQCLAALWLKFSKFPRGSKTCKIEFRIII